MSKFSVGEVAIIAFSVFESYPVGSEVTILEVRHDGPLGLRYVIDRYRDEWGDLFLFTAEESSLRKKRPPDDIKREETGDWDLCPWRPEKVQEPQAQLPIPATGSTAVRSAESATVRRERFGEVCP